MPFGGAFVGLEGIKHLVAFVSKVEVDFAEPAAVAFGGAVRSVDQLPRLPPPVRGRRPGDRPRFGAVFYDFPSWLLLQPLVRLVVESLVFTALWRFAL